MGNPSRLWLCLTLAGVLVSPLMLVAGPPFVTDDPVPVEFRHWEVYLASVQMNSGGGWSGTAPHVEVNYGVIPDVQLHLITPFAYDAPATGGSHYGYGDTELGVKYRFIAETDNIPQIGVFPLLEVPSGDPDRGLGGGHVQAFLPLWIQKSWGQKDSQWTTYGGGGYWVNPGAGNQNWGFIGWLIQKQFPNHLTIGGELFHETAKQIGSDSDTIINVGGIYDFTDRYHFMLTAGHTIQGPHEFIAYVGFQWTFGPMK